MSEKRQYLGGVPQPTERERRWANDVAKLIVQMAKRHDGSDDELEGQIAHELRAAVSLLNGSD